MADGSGPGGVGALWGGGEAPGRAFGARGMAENGSLPKPKPISSMPSNRLVAAIVAIACNIEPTNNIALAPKFRVACVLFIGLRLYSLHIRKPPITLVPGRIY